MKHSPNEAQRMWADLALMADTLRRDWMALDRALMDCQLGYPTSSGHGGGVSGGDVSDPTGRFGLQDNDAARDRVELYGWLAKAHAAVLGMHQVRSRWRPATAIVKRCANPDGCPKFNLAAEGRGGMCWSCYRAGVRPPQPPSEPSEDAA